MDPEFAKLVTLARGARGRVGAIEGAALRDSDGRTYSAATVSLPSLSLSAVQLSVASAAASGSRGLEAVVLCSSGSEVRADDLQAVRDLAGTGVTLTVVDAAGTTLAEVTT